jgi:hypothetical protein
MLGWIMLGYTKLGRVGYARLGYRNVSQTMVRRRSRNKKIAKIVSDA